MKSRSRKDILYAEAAQLFMQKGYPATSIRELAEKIGIEPSSIYSHIRSKEELLSKICLDAAHYFSSGMKKIMASQGTAKVKIDLLIDLHIDAVTKLPASITVFNDEWKHLPHHVKHEFLGIRDKYQEHWIDLINEGIHEGSIRSLDPFLLKEMILSSLRWIHSWQDEDKSKKLNAMRSEIKSILFTGFTAKQEADINL